MPAVKRAYRAPWLSVTRRRHCYLVLEARNALDRIQRKLVAIADFKNLEHLRQFEEWMWSYRSRPMRPAPSDWQS